MVVKRPERRLSWADRKTLDLRTGRKAKDRAFFPGSERRRAGVNKLTVYAHTPSLLLKGDDTLYKGNDKE